MALRSTRGGRGCSLAAGVLAGWAADGGLLLPSRLPAPAAWRQWRGLAYPQLCAAILRACGAGGNGDAGDDDATDATDAADDDDGGAGGGLPRAALEAAAARAFGRFGGGAAHAGRGPQAAAASLPPAPAAAATETAAAPRAGGGVVPCVRVDTAFAGSARASVCAAELWHGPSLAFKDLGMAVLSQLLRADGAG
jgi:hypothetical protein